LRHGISVMKGYVFVGEKLAAEASFVGQIIKNKE
jgi:UDP-3-O-[3-hydroxymyristoyl] N-acetylglucosamine deacetylase/3-hydroxyacyl-[acyl-carrier-protein] dehydratase